MAIKKGLGRGLNTMISSAELPAKENLVSQLNIIDVEPNPDQPRKNFDKEALDALSGSIKEIGVILPIIVIKTESGRYQIIAGERRWRAARLAGLGFIGKSGLFISKDYGSKIRLATVLTDAPLVSDNTPLESMCKGCNKCVLACPAGAISGKEYVEGMQREEFFSAEKCSHNMKNYKDIGRGAVCGICIKVCPFNKLK